MTIMRFDPFRELDRLGERLLGSAIRSMPTEAFRRGDTFYVLIDVPGVDADGIDVTVERNVVSVRTSRTSPRQDTDELLVDERPHGRFSRQFFLGDNLDASKLTADVDRGVLSLTIPVAAESKPRQIPVASSTAATDGSVDASDSGKSETTADSEPQPATSGATS